MNAMKMLFPGAACAALALVVAACAGGGDGGGARSGSDDEAVVLADAVRVSGVDRATVNQDGKVRYTVDNVSGADQEDLAWSVSFLFPPRPGDTEGEGDIAVAEEAETTAERTLVLLRGEKGKVLEAVCGAFNERRAAGQQVVGTRLNVAPNPPVPTVARTATSQGTRFMGRIECVAQTKVWEGDSMTLEFENVSSAKVSDLELQIVFPYGAKDRQRSKWRAIPSLAPGQRAKVVVDFKDLDKGDGTFLVKVRLQAL